MSALLQRHDNADTFKPIGSIVCQLPYQLCVTPPSAKGQWSWGAGKPDEGQLGEPVRADESEMTFSRYP